MSRLSRLVFGSDGDLVRETNAQAVFAAHASVITATAVLSPLIADLAELFEVSEARAGLLIVVYTATLTVSIPVAGVVADRVGQKATVVPGLALFGLAGGSIAFVHSFEVALGLRVLQAVGVAFTQPVLVAMLGALYSGSREATAQGVRVAVDSVVSAVTPVAAGLLFVLAWQYPFYIYFFVIPLALIAWFVLPEIDGGPTRTLSEYARDLATAFVTPAIILLMISFFFRHTLIYGMYTYISVLAIQEAGMAVVMVGVLLGIRAVMKTLSSTQAGRLAGIYGPALVALAGFGLLGGGMFVMGFVPTSLMLIVGIMMFGFGDGLLSPTQKSLVNVLAPPEYRNSLMSAGFTFVNIGKTVGPIVVGIGLGIVGPAFAFALLGAIGGGLGVASLAGVARMQEIGR